MAHIHYSIYAVKLKILFLKQNPDVEVAYISNNKILQSSTWINSVSIAEQLMRVPRVQEVYSSTLHTVL